MQKQNDEALVQEMQRRLGMADEELETAERTAPWPDTRLVELCDEQLFALAIGEVAG